MAKFLDDTGLQALINKIKGSFVTGGKSGSANGTIKLTINGNDTSDIAVTGLKSAAYTESSDYLASTTTYAGSSSKGGAATSANKVNSSLKIQLNSGTTEGTNQFTFDGSGAKTVNITPSAIGAATSGHNHDTVYLKLAGGALTGDVTTSVTSFTNSSLVTKTYVDEKIAAADAMVYHGIVYPSNDSTSGHNHLPTSGVVVGDTYKAAGTTPGSTYATGVTANLGDIIIAKTVSGTTTQTITWDVIPSGDDIVDVQNGTGLSRSLSGGVITLGHSNSVTAVGTAALLKVKYDAQGHITGSSAIAQSDITGLGVISNAIVTNATDSTTATASTANSFINFLSNTTKKFGFAIKGGTGITVANDASNNITITPTVQGVTVSNGLSLSSGKVTMAVGTNSTPGAVKVTNGNGLAINNSTGEISMSVASGSAAGAMSSADYSKLSLLQALPTAVGTYTYNVTTAGTAGAYTAMQFISTTDIDNMWVGSYTA